MEAVRLRWKYPRAFADDPEAEPFLTVPALEELNKSARQYLLDQSFELLESSLQIRMNDQKWYLPQVCIRIC